MDDRDLRLAAVRARLDAVARTSDHSLVEDPAAHDDMAELVMAARDGQDPEAVLALGVFSMYRHMNDRPAAAGAPHRARHGRAVTYPDMLTLPSRTNPELTG